MSLWAHERSWRRFSYEATCRDVESGENWHLCLGLGRYVPTLWTLPTTSMNLIKLTNCHQIHSQQYLCIAFYLI